MLKQLLLLIVCCCALFKLYAAKVNVKILSNVKLNSVIISTFPGEYSINADGATINDTTINIFQLTIAENYIQLATLERIIGRFSVIKFNANTATSNINIKSNSLEKKLKTFQDNLEISVSNNAIRIINITDIEHYIGGVIEAEAGLKAAPEYYKLQAILCRTYALTHLRRHEAEGFQLCDQVHCQVFSNSTKNKEILTAVIETKGLVIVDSELNLIIAAFHSNCGGQTINSEDVWSLPTSYLKSVTDTFCLQQRHAQWTKKITLKEWTNYIDLKHKTPSSTIDTALYNSIAFSQNNRSIFFTDKALKIPLKTIRSDWSLNSTYFSINQHKDSLIFSGRGYGHGVGLCQEGAMKMAKTGIPYTDILHFYYKNVHLVNLTALNIFKQ